MNLTIEATYLNGVLVPISNLDLPENITYQVQIVSAVEEKTKRKSLFGAFPELAALTDALDDTKQIWNDSLDKQLSIIQSKAG